MSDSCLSVNSQNEKINSRKRSQGQDTEKQENQMPSTVDNDHDEHLQENINPTNAVRSNISLGKNKKRRRY